MAKKKLNAYLKKVNAARKADAASFKYKDQIYVKFKTKSGMVSYRKKK